MRLRRLTCATLNALVSQAPKRKAAPELAVSEAAAPPGKRAAGGTAEPAGVKAARTAGGAGALTLRELQADRLTAVADANWRLPEGTPRPALDDTLVEKIYAEELGGGERAPSVQRVSVLEISQVCFTRRFSRLACGSRLPPCSQYLELYLWPHFDAKAASVNHVLSVLLMVNEKFREGVAGWKCFTDTEKFALLFKRCVAHAPLLLRILTACPCSVLSLKSERELTVPERTAYLVFMINVFQSLENELIRSVALPLVSLPLWHSLSPGRLQVRPSLARMSLPL